MRPNVIFLFLPLVACGGKPPTPVAAAPVVTQQAVTPVVQAAPPVASPTVSRALLDGYIAALNSHDADRAASHLAQDAVVFDALQGILTHGQTEARDKVIGMYLRALPDAHWTLRGEPVLSESGISYEWALTGVNLGDFTTYMRGKGQKIDFKGITLLRVKEGKIAYQANYFDPSVLAAQAGW